MKELTLSSSLYIPLCATDHVMPEMVSYQTFIVEAQIKFHMSLCGISSGKSGIGTGLSLGISVSSCHYHSINTPYPYVIHQPPHHKNLKKKKSLSLSLSHPNFSSGFTVTFCICFFISPMTLHRRNIYNQVLLQWQ